VHGDSHATLKVKTPAFTGEVRKRIKEIAALLAGNSPPDLVLNRHCGQCEFSLAMRARSSCKRADRKALRARWGRIVVELLDDSAFHQSAFGPSRQKETHVFARLHADIQYVLA
jgi:hypothetical protein